MASTLREPEIISEAVVRGAHVIVDPVSSDWYSYASATTVTPNLKEIEGKVFGDSAAESLYWERKRFDIENILVTRGAYGLLHSGPDGCIEDVPEKVEVVDATGAGDTVVDEEFFCKELYSMKERKFQVVKKQAG